jgi:hypothetical protein
MVAAGRNKFSVDCLKFGGEKTEHLSRHPNLQHFPIQKEEFYFSSFMNNIDTECLRPVTRNADTAASRAVHSVMTLSTIETSQSYVNIIESRRG